jgi:hypothetical protein
MKSSKILAQELSRRKFIRTTALAGLGSTLAGAITCTDANAAVNTACQASTPGFPYKMVFNSDVCNSATLYSSYNTSPTQAYSAAHIMGSVAETANNGAQCHMFSPNTCFVPWWQSAVYPLRTHVNWVIANYGNTLSSFDPITKWVLLGNDLVQTYITACRLNNMAAFVSFRMNDVQLCANALNFGTPLPEWQSVGFNNLYAQHPEYCLGGVGTDLSVYANAAQDWTIPAVVAYKLSLVNELCTNYDLDGFELDFVRETYYFNQSSTTLSQRQTIISAFIAQVRATLSARTDRYRYLSLRVPCDTNVCNEIGINLAALSSLGVDMITVSPSYFTLQASGFAAIKAAVGSLPSNLEMTNNDQGGYMLDTTSNPEVYSSKKTYRRTTYQQLYTTAYVGYAQGATGMSLFNFAYYRNNVYQTGGDPPYSDPPLDAMINLKNPTALGTQPQHYFNAGSAGIMTSSEIPVIVTVNKSFNLDFTLQAPTGGWKNGGVFRLECGFNDEGEPPYTFTGTTWQVTLTNSTNPNGVTLTPTTNISEPYASIWTQFLGTPDQILAWSVPANLLQTGTNTFVCTCTLRPQYLRITYADLAVS